MRPSLFLLLLATGLPAQQPAPIVGPLGVQHGATFQILTAPPFSGRPGGLAPGALFRLFGSHLGPSELIADSAPYGLRLPDAPGGTEVHIRSILTGKVAQAQMVFVQDFQIAAIMPRDFPLGDAEVRVWTAGGASEPVTVPVVFSFPGLFTLTQDGHGRAVVQNVEPDGTLEINGLTRSARPGQFVTLWATGLGNARGEEVRVVFGVESYPVDFAGPAPGLPGLDQINVRLPDDLPNRGCYVRLVASGDGLGTGPASIAISDEGGACDHPWGLSAERMAEIEAGSPARVLALSLTSHFSTLERMEPPANAGASGAGGNAFAWDVAQIERQSLDRFPRPVSHCGGVEYVSFSSAAFPDLPPISPPPFIDIPSEETPAGHPWMLTGPDGRTLTLGSRALARSQGAVASEEQEAGFVTAGEWTASIPGGAEIGPLDLTLAMPAMPSVVAPATIRRGEDFEVSWPIEQVTAKAEMTVELKFWQPIPGQPGAFEVDALACQVQDGADRLAIPLSFIRDSLERAREGELTVTVRLPQQPAHSSAVDRVEASAIVSSAWPIPLE